MKLTRCDACQLEIADGFHVSVAIFDGSNNGVRFEGRADACSMECAAKLLREQTDTLDRNMQESAHARAAELAAAVDDDASRK